MFDLHIHSNTSPDSKITIQGIYAEAEKKGMHTICITNHHESLDTEHPNWTYTNEQIQECREQISQLKGKTKILLGVELGYDENEEQAIRPYLKKHEFDFVIGSIHMVNGMDVCHPGNRGKFPPSALMEYFRLIKKAIAFGEFDVIGHIDGYLKTMTMESPGFEELKPHWEEVAELMLKHIVGFEINTSRDKYAPGEFYPSAQVIELLIEKEVNTITIGSDAHTYERIGHNYEKVVEFLKSHGIGELSVFQQRKRSAYPI